MEFNIARYHTIRRVAGISNEFAVKLPPKLARKQAVINVHNKGDDCFKYALLSVLHYKDIDSYRQRPTKYMQWMNENNWEGITITMPMTSDQLSMFEKQNPGIVINLLEW